MVMKSPQGQSEVGELPLSMLGCGFGPTKTASASWSASLQLLHQSLHNGDAME